MKTSRRVNEPLVAIDDMEKWSTTGEGIKNTLKNLPLDRIIRPSDTVAVKPNLVSQKAVESSGVTSAEALRAIIQLVKEYNPKRILVVEGSGGDPTEKLLHSTGADRVIQDEGVEFINLNDKPTKSYSIEHDKPSSVEMNPVAGEIDVLISTGVLKMHNEATVTATMKNISLSFPAGVAYGSPKADVSGIPNPSRTDLHADLHGFIVAMNKLLPIGLAILEMDKVMIGSGPSEGAPVEARMFMAGTNPLTLDSIGARFMGFKPQAVRYIWQGAYDNMGEVHLDKIKFTGLDFESASKLFSKRVFGKEIVVT